MSTASTWVCVGRAVAALSLVALGVAVSGYSAPAHADQLDRERRFDIPAQPLSTALVQFSRQAEVQLVTSSVDLAAREAPGVSGQLSIRRALEALLDGSGLSYDLVGRNTVAIRLAGAASEGAAPPEPGSETQTGSPTPLRQARAGAPSSSTVVRKSEESSPDGRLIGEIVVTGTHIRGAGNVGAPLLEIDREDIERSGYSTVQDLMRSLPQNFGGGANEDPNGLDSGSLAGGFGSSINLRGLGTDSTLVLVNGRRLGPSGFFADFVDVGLIPLSAVQRIEVLTDGASALYGSDAVGGVVNFIMRTDYAGAESGLRIGSAQGGNEELQLTQALGKSWSGGQALIVYEYHDRDHLASAERDFTADSDLTRLGGSNFRTSASNPGNILDARSFDLIAVPPGQDGTALTPADFIPGVVNLQNTQAGTFVLPDREQHNVFATAAHALSESIRVFGDARYSRRDYAHRIPADNRQGLFVPATNAFYVDPSGGLSEIAFGGLFVDYSFLDDFGPTEERGNAETVGGAIGAEFKLGRSWQAQIHGSLNEWSGTDRVDNVANGAVLDAFLADADPATAFNPFGDGSHSNPATLAQIGVGFDEFTADSQLWMVHAKADGAVFALPGGTGKLAVGAEYRSESGQSQSLNFRTSAVPTPDPFRKGDRDVIAGFAELYLPWVTAANGRAGLRRLEMSVAARQEEYSDFGSTFDPRVGMRWSPVGGLALRGTFGTSFRAPLLSELLRADDNTVLLFPVPDSDAASGFTNAVLIAGTRSNLQPEQTSAWTLGVELQPPFAAGLDVEVSYFNIEIEDRIQGAVQNFFQVLGNDEIYGPLITRNPSDEDVNRWIADPGFTGCCISLPLPPGEVFGAIIDGRTTNIATSTLRGLDLLASYGFDAAIGAFDLQVAATCLLDVKQGITPAAPQIEQVSTLRNPVDFKLRSSASWSRGPFGASAAITYVDNYMDENPVTGVREVDSWTTVDLQLSYSTRAATGPDILDNVRAVLVVRNLLDEDPPFANIGFGVGYDVTNADPLGRVVTLQLTKRW